jgi:hypothetical protein
MPRPDQWLVATTKRSTARTALFLSGNGVMIASFVRTGGEGLLVGWSLTVGALMVTLACLIPWLKRAEASPKGGLKLEMRDTAELSTELAVADKTRVLPDIWHTAHPNEVIDTTRFLVADFTVNALLTREHSTLADCEFHLYLFDEEADRLFAIFEPPEDEGGSEGWLVGQGATGVAWEQGEYVLVQGPEVSDPTYGLTPAQQTKYADLTAVAAMPVLNASGLVIAILSASSRHRDPALANMEGFREHVALAEAVARILIDLLQWHSD